ncbi:MAG: trwC5, partial [Solirubrobacterales bacterium]|nr:trwC5 [Solirubrobacterales bacterium]
TGGVYRGPAEAARLRAGDLLVIDEAGMLDQDTARALLTITDEEHVRVALLGDRHQLAAVGRGGILDLAIAEADPAAHLTLDAVHRFTRTEHTGRVTPDVEYAELTLAMRTGDNPGAVFDALAARGRIRLHPDAAALTQALAVLTATHHRDGEREAVVVDTREQAAELNGAIRERLVADGRVGDIRVAVTRAGERIGVGDGVATRRNDRNLRVANRDTWTVTAVDELGNITVTPDVTPARTAASRVTGNVTLTDVTPADDRSASTERRVLPPDYVAHHVELAYASTAHGVQGETVLTAHVLIGERTGAAAAYVGMTRGRQANTAHLVADDLGQAREQWIAVFRRDRADLGPGHAAQLAAAEAAHYARPRPLEHALAELHAAWTAEQRFQDRLDVLEMRRKVLRSVVAADDDHANQLSGLQDRYRETTIALQEAKDRAAAAGATVIGEADRLRDTLLDQWDAQREDARQAARIVLSGPGRLGLRRAAVHRAEQQLTNWADPWRPYVATLPTNLRQLAAVASSDDDRPGLRARLQDVARRQAESTHPEHLRLRSAADAAHAVHDHVSRALQDAHRRQHTRLTRLASQDHLAPAAQLASAGRDITATERELAVARIRMAELAADPALLAQPAGRLAQERDDWRVRYDAERAARRTAASVSSPSGSARSVLPPEPVSRRTSAPGAGRGIGR